MVFVNCRPTKPRIELMKEACIGRRYFSQLASIRPKEVFSCLVTVRYIHKISINCVCSGCGNAITRGTCTYVGCHWNQPSCKVDLKAWYVPDPVTILIVLANVCLCVCVARPPPFFFFRRVCVCRPSSCTLALYLSLQRGAIDFRLRHTHTEPDLAAAVSLSAASNSFYVVFSLCCSLFLSLFLFVRYWGECIPSCIHFLTVCY